MRKRPDLCCSAIWNSSSCLTPLKEKHCNLFIMAAMYPPKAKVILVLPQCNKKVISDGKIEGLIEPKS